MEISDATAAFAVEQAATWQHRQHDGEGQQCLSTEGVGVAPTEMVAAGSEVREMPGVVVFVVLYHG